MKNSGLSYGLITVIISVYNAEIYLKKARIALSIRHV